MTHPGSAEAIAAAHDRQGPIGYPGPPPKSLAEAEAVQDAVLACLGWRAGAWKLGATTHAAKDALGLPRAFSGMIPAERTLESGVRLGRKSLSQSGVEAEPAVRLARDLSADDLITREAPEKLFESAHAAIEIPQTRFASLGAEGPLALVADNGAAGYAVVGPPGPIEALNGPLRASVRLDEATLVTGDRTALLAPPLALALDHLRRITSRGYRARAGEVLLLGSVTRYQPIVRPGCVTVMIDELGPVTFDYE